jgi:hypothetical protein
MQGLRIDPDAAQDSGASEVTGGLQHDSAFVRDGRRRLSASPRGARRLTRLHLAPDTRHRRQQITEAMVANVLSNNERALINAYWRAANCLSVGQIYLYDNPLLKRTLTKDHIKPRLLGHWGTTPGLNFIYAHLNGWPEQREYERCLVALMNAYVEPMMTDYLAKLSQRIRRLGIDAPIYITSNNGGTLSIDTARQRPIDTILSGAASGVVAASAVVGYLLNPPGALTRRAGWREWLGVH